MKHLDLFSGIGGFALACEWAGIETIGFVEIAPFCQKVLKKHWPEVKIVGDIHDVKEDTFQRPVDLITGGFPCQPFSIAGKRKGKTDDRFLWPEMLRVIKAYQPTWVLGENVAGIIRMELDNCLSDLENIGYETQAMVIPACAVNAPHRRDRVFLLGYSKSGRLKEQRECQPGAQARACAQRASSLADSLGVGQQGVNTREGFTTQENQEGASGRCGLATLATEQGLEGEAGPSVQRAGKRFACPSRGEWWAVEPNVGRVANGIPSRVDRLKCLGNAVVVPLIYEIIKAIQESEQC